MTHKFKSEVRYRDNNPGNPQTYALYRDWYTQNKPWRQPLPWSVSRRQVLRYQTNSPFGNYPFYPQLSNITDFPSGTLDVAFAKSYEKLFNQVGDTSSWGENLAEGHQAINTIVSRARQLAAVASSLHRGNIGSALNQLAHPDTNSIRRKLGKAKSFSNQWLELHFGWVPMVNDISNSLNTLSKTDFGLRKVSGGSSTKEVFHVREDDGAGGYHIRHIETSVRCRATAWVRVSNPNAFLANQFGVANPLSVAWNLIPYSFVVDWFSNVGQCLNAMTDWVGLAREREQTSFSSDVVWSDYYLYSNTVPPNDPPYITVDSMMKGLYVGRMTSIPAPPLILKPFKGFSPVRGATAIALLLQKL